MNLVAEVISIGDEIVSGQRLDTNTQWISKQLGDLGVPVRFHSTIGDNLEDNIAAFKIAAQRADIVVATGGLGPTADDLTREAIAKAANVDLEFQPEVLKQIEAIFERFGRAMPENNKIQAYFPSGANVVDNPEGTAPGIDFAFKRTDKPPSRIFALPGVPAEMKEMWRQTVFPTIRKMTGDDLTIHHHVIHCFGVGESQAELMVPNLTKRGRNPSVGITASSATISFRITARATSVDECVQQMQPTIEEIETVMGDYVFGENGELLQDVLTRELLRLDRTLAIVDFGLSGDVAQAMLGVESHQDVFAGSLAMNRSKSESWLGQTFELETAAHKVKSQFDADIGLAIDHIKPPSRDNQRPTFEISIADQCGLGVQSFELTHGGHSSYRQLRSVKQVLNQLRLLLK